MDGSSDRQRGRASSHPLHQQSQSSSSDEPPGPAGASATEHMSQQASLLPSIEHFDPQRNMQSQQPQQHPPPQHPPPPPYPLNGAPMQPQQHPQPYPPPQYQYQNGAMPPGAMPSNVANGQQNGMHMRFPIPPQPSLSAQQMPGGRHKKEIKRRTKTGCFTCRKRRIKVSCCGCGLARAVATCASSRLPVVSEQPKTNKRDLVCSRASHRSASHREFTDRARSVTRAIRPAATARRASASAWATTPSSSNKAQPTSSPRLQPTHHPLTTQPSRPPPSLPTPTRRRSPFQALAAPSYLLPARRRTAPSSPLSTALHWTLRLPAAIPTCTWPRTAMRRCSLSEKVRIEVAQRRQS